VKLIKAVEPRCFLLKKHIVALEIQRESQDSFMIQAFTTASDSYMQMVILKKNIPSYEEAERFILHL